MSSATGLVRGGDHAAGAFLLKFSDDVALKKDMGFRQTNRRPHSMPCSTKFNGLNYGAWPPEALVLADHLAPEVVRQLTGELSFPAAVAAAKASSRRSCAGRA